MAILYKVTATAGKYTDAEGNEKNRYVDMGVVMETKNGPMLKLEAMPIGWDGWAYLNDPAKKDGQGGAGGARGGAPQRERPQRATDHPGHDDFKDDDIPFATNRSAW